MPQADTSGLNFSHRAGKTAAPPSAPKLLANPLSTPVARPAAPSAPSQSAAPSSTPVRPPQPANPAAAGAVRPLIGPSVRPPGVSATPSARPPLGQQAPSGQTIRPSFNGPNGPNGPNGAAPNGPGMNQMRPGMMARPPLGGGIKSGNAFGTPPAGLARPPQAPRGVRGVSGSGSSTAPALPAEAGKAAPSIRPGVTNAASTGNSSSLSLSWRQL